MGSHPALAGVAECASASRLLGGHSSLALAGGGNTSWKDADTVHVKASGYSLATLSVEGFAAVDRAGLADLMQDPPAGDGALLDAMAALQDAVPPKVPSIEAPVHHVIPAATVLHTHADAIVTLTNAVGWRDHVDAALGAVTARLDYFKPGLDLSREVADLVREGRLAVGEAADIATGLVLRHHGLFTAADRAEDAYTHHIALVRRAQEYIAAHTGIAVGRSEALDAVIDSATDADPALVARISEAAGAPRTVVEVTSPGSTQFLSRDDIPSITQRGTATLEHVIYTKRVPCLGTTAADIDQYVANYGAYFERWRDERGENISMLSPEPRVLLDGGRMFAVGKDRAQASLVASVYLHTMGVIMAAEGLGGYSPVSEGDSFDIEYWELEQRKLRSS
ncbi:class II aldolase/adducin family protein [Demequina sp. B12]|uniref:class II aldolase/adducin family protein n=1 Tax=Demequina sp. B12 TaxID=2992757 RepID=UPI00237C3704|nr:class II aldolase/adducin family protein [Demequina sp. B12]MDE0573572.1 class II aldolase/adducin family protein [Demequina sp. B12]